MDWVDCDPGVAKKTIHPLGYSTWLLDGHVLLNGPMRACPGAFAGSVGKTLSVHWACWTEEREADSCTSHLARLLDGDNLLDSEANSEGSRAQRWKETEP